jgi:hypothetical protein
MRRLLALALAAVLAAALLGALGSRPGSAGALPAGPTAVATEAQTGDPAGDPAADPDGDASTDDEPVPGGDIIPQPNSGREPTEAGDRGGALQGLVFVLILAGLGTILGLAIRGSRTARRRSATAAGGDRRPAAPSPIADVLGPADDNPADDPADDDAADSSAGRPGADQPSGA